MKQPLPAMAALLLTAIATPSFAQWGEWTVLATMRSYGGGTVDILYRYYHGGNGWNHRVQWGVRNNTNQTLYDVAIFDKTYYCTNGTIHTGSSEGVEYRIGPAESGTTISDNISSDDCPRLRRVELDSLHRAIRFNLEAGQGIGQPWGTYGTVTEN